MKVLKKLTTAGQGVVQGESKKRKHSLRTKLLLFIILLLAIAILAISTIAISMSRNGLLTNVKTDITTMGGMVNDDITGQLSAYGNQVKYLAASPLFHAKNMTDKELYKELNAAKGDYDIESIGLVTPSGGLITDSTTLTVGMLDSSMIAIAKQDGVSFGAPVTDANGNLVSVICAGNADGYVVVSIQDGAFYSDMVKDFKVGKTGRVILVDDAGTIIGANDQSLVTSQTNFIKDAEQDSSLASASAIYSKAISGKTGIGQYKYNGVDRLAYYSNISGTKGWSYVVVAPVNEMITSINTIVLAIIIISIIVLVVGIILALMFANGLIRPITAMNKRLELLSQGDVFTPLSVKTSGDEIGEMVDSMQKTLSRLKAYIKDLSKGLQKAANCEFDNRPQEVYLGDFEALEKALTTTFVKLADTIRHVIQSADQVAVSADQVSSSSQILAQGATEQASSVQELSATASVIATNVQDNAHNATSANEIARKVGSELEKSNSYMANMLDAMKEIDQTSEEIGKIIKTIDSIAFQTNILALNAAVEAARAGEAGKGFAVVADEVRNLASKSAAAAKDTTALIESSVIAVQKGSKIANDTANSLSSVVSDAREIINNMEEIAIVSQKQSVDIHEITQGLDQISSVVQTNSATSEESAAASEELSGQAHILKDMMQKFKLGDEELTEDLLRELAFEIPGGDDEEDKEVDKKPVQKHREEQVASKKVTEHRRPVDFSPSINNSEKY